MSPLTRPNRMKARSWVLCGLLVALLVTYAAFFTEWLRPAPIEIASQVRFALQPPRFGRPVVKKDALGKPGQTNQVVPRNVFEIIGRPEKGTIDQAPGGAANVTFSLDNWYTLTKIRVQDVPADGSAPQMMWELVGKSRPVNSLLYGRVPDGMRPILEGLMPEPLKPGVPYRLILEAGRRRGTNNFRTVELRTTE
jgi:hypothetical protein